MPNNRSWPSVSQKMLSPKQLLARRSVRKAKAFVLPGNNRFSWLKIIKRTLSLKCVEQKNIFLSDTLFASTRYGTFLFILPVGIKFTSYSDNVLLSVHSPMHFKRRNPSVVSLLEEWCLCQLTGMHLAHSFLHEAISAYTSNRIYRFSVATLYSVPGSCFVGHLRQCPWRWYGVYLTYSLLFKKNLFTYSCPFL